MHIFAQFGLPQTTVENSLTPPQLSPFCDCENKFNFNCKTIESSRGAELGEIAAVSYVDIFYYIGEDNFLNLIYFQLVLWAGKLFYRYFEFIANCEKLQISRRRLAKSKKGLKKSENFCDESTLTGSSTAAAVPLLSAVHTHLTEFPKISAIACACRKLSEFEPSCFTEKHENSRNSVSVYIDKINSVKKVY